MPLPWPDFTPRPPEAYLEAARAEADRIRLGIEVIATAADVPTFANTVLALDDIDVALNDIATDFFTLLSSIGESSYHEKAGEMSALLSAASNDITMHAGVFARLKRVYEGEEALGSAEKRLTEKLYRGFVRGGALLSVGDQERLRAIDEELSRLSAEFGKRSQASREKIALFVEEETSVKGVPAEILAAARARAQEQGKSGYVFSGSDPEAVAVLSFAPDAEVRKRMLTARGTIATSGEEENWSVIDGLIRARTAKAQLLGFATWADFVLEERMAKRPENVQRLLDTWREPIVAAAKKDVAEAFAFANLEATAENYAYAAKRLEEHALTLSQEQVKKYFPLPAILKGWFGLVGEWYGLTFTRIDRPTYHPDIMVYEVQKNGQLWGYLWLDLFARKGKQSGAWMNNLRGQRTEDGRRVPPIITVTGNFTAPLNDAPACLTHDELVTFCHEFGHALQGLLSDVPYRGIAGTNVAWDVVELPSQFTENFAYEPWVLARLSAHTETGEPIPEDIAEKLGKQLMFQAGAQFARQLLFVDLDWHWHAVPQLVEQSPAALAAAENAAVVPWRVIPPLPGTALSPNFLHIFDGGYSAGYYSYKWAEMLDADAFLYAKKQGFAQEVFAKFAATVLSQGDTVEAADLYRSFRGQDPDPNAILERLGLSAA